MDITEILTLSHVYWLKLSSTILFQSSFKSSEANGLSWNQSCFSTYPQGFSGSKRKYGSKPSFHGFVYQQIGLLPQTWGSRRSWTCPDLMPQLLVPRKMSILDFILPKEVLVVQSTMVLQRTILIDMQRVSSWGWGIINSRWAGDHRTFQAVGAVWVRLFYLLAFSFISLLASSTGIRAPWKVLWTMRLW